MSALDLKLIHEFKLTPAFYNKNSARFKDKAFVERAWNNISRKLGYDANILKDRMYQLRNRYNLEKRKLQSMREEGISNPKTMWPLYHNLNFLSSHIRQRKSYKMINSAIRGPGFRGFTEEEGRLRIGCPYSLGRSVEIKEEVDNQHYDNVNGTIDSDHSDCLMNETMNDSDVHHIISKTSKTLQNINRLKQSLLADHSSDSTAPPKKRLKHHHPSHKFEAFGSFVNNSLQDLPPHKALEMIDRFTSDIVQALTAYHMERDIQSL